MRDRFDVTEQSVKRNVRNYNIMLTVLCLSNLGLLLYFFFTPVDVSVRLPIGVELAFNSLFLIIYSYTCAKLYRRLKAFKDEGMQNELHSIKM